MQYDVSIEVLYVADQEAPDYVCDMVRSAMLADVRIKPTHLSVQLFARNILASMASLPELR
jgi:hypothetical protein